MQQFQSQYRGGRENLLGLSDLKAPPIFGFATQMAHDAGTSVYGRLAQRQRTADTLMANMAMREYDNARQDQLIEQQLGLNNQHAAEANKAAETSASDMNAGTESAMLDWANNVLGSYQPDSPEFNQANKMIQMIQDRPTRGSSARDKAYLGYMLERNIADPFSQGALGAAGWQPKAPVKKPSSQQKKPIYTYGGYAGLDKDLHD